jgi:hypothetical protein
MAKKAKTTEPKPVDGRFVSVQDGLALLRNFADEPTNWRILTNDGKWMDGSDYAARMLFKGELGYDDITPAEAEALASKLGGSLDDAR